MLAALKSRVRRLLVLAALVALATLVAWVYCGVGEYFLLSAVANEFPRPPDTHRVRAWPYGDRTYTDMPTPLPPDSWSMLETHFVPEGTTRQEIMDFYISNMPPGWRWCPERDDATYGDGVFFVKGAKWVALDTYGLRHSHLSPSYDIYIERNAKVRHCE